MTSQTTITAADLDRTTVKVEFLGLGPDHASLWLDVAYISDYARRGTLSPEDAFHFEGYPANDLLQIQIAGQWYQAVKEVPLPGDVHAAFTAVVLELQKELKAAGLTAPQIRRDALAAALAKHEEKKKAERREATLRRRKR